MVRTVTHTLRKLGVFTEQEAIGFTQPFTSAAINHPPSGASGGSWLLVHQKPAATHVEMGLSGDTIDVTEHSIVTRFRYVKEPRAQAVSPAPQTESTP